MDDQKMIIRGKGSFVANAKILISKYLKLIISIAIILAVFYFAIVMSLFLIILLLVFGIISYLAMKFQKKKDYYKMDDFQ